MNKQLLIIGLVSVGFVHTVERSILTLAVQKARQINQGATIDQVKRELGIGSSLSDESGEQLVKEIARQYYLLYGKYLTIDYDYGFSIRELIRYRKLPLKEVHGVLNIGNLRINSLDGIDQIPTKELVTTLNLSNNELTFLPDFAFPGFGNLVRLIISHNDLVEISDHAFAGLISLENLDLSYNKLTDISISEFTVSDLLELWHLNLIGNVFSRRQQQLIRNYLRGITVRFSAPARVQKNR